MQNIIDNYTNGNLTEARRLAKRKSFISIRAALQEMGYSPNKAMLTATFLKTGREFQAACDAK